MNNGNVNTNNKYNNNLVRPVSEFQKKMTKESLYEAYWQCRTNKRGNVNASLFEADYEMNLSVLYVNIQTRNYEPNRSTAFIVTRPVQREIFAADFRDRIIHHWIAIRTEPQLEALFIPDSFNCRKGKGNSEGIKRLHQTIKECSDNYTGDCYVMKLDLKGFFMSINRYLLTEKLCKFIETTYTGDDLETLLYLTRKILMNAPEDNCIRKGNPSDWDGLPSNKSLFTTPKGYGLPIGNLTSQMAANFLLNDTDHFISETLGLRIGRYVDDYYLVDQSKERLLSAVPVIRAHLKEFAGVELHPNKFYLQHYTKGIKFIGAVVKGDRIYIANRTVSHAQQAIHRFNRVAQPRYAEDFALSINSYLGAMKHYRSYNIRKKLIGLISPEWMKVLNVAEDYTKVVVKKKYKHRERLKYALLKQRRQRRK